MTFRQDILAEYQPLVHLLAQIAAKGMKISVSTNFYDFAELIPKIRGRDVSPMFNPHLCDIGSHNGFWMRGENAKGEIVHVQAARLDELRNQRLDEFLESLDAYYSSPHDFKRMGEYCLSPADATHQITGRVAYQGELWLKGGAGGVRARGFPPLVTTLSAAIILTTWAPDYTYAMVQPRIVRTGMAHQYGYTHMEPHGILWNRPYVPEYLDEWVIWRDRCQLTGQVSVN